MKDKGLIEMPSKEGGVYYLHTSSFVDENAQIGEGTKIWHFSHIMSGAKIGARCSLGQNVNVGSRAVLGNNVKVQNNVSIYDDVIIEDDVFCGPSMVFTNVINPRAFIERKHEYKKTYVKRGASIGANATIVCGVVLGEYCFVGAGSVVTRDVPAHALVYGNPARQYGWVCKCGNKLTENLQCPTCGMKYRQNNQGLEEIPCT
jgi:UDP-2-acetamido-3-amino-2,3-dideoxy-glucuronate N-acetyltransferase